MIDGRGSREITSKEKKIETFFLVNIVLPVLVGGILYLFIWQDTALSYIVEGFIGMEIGIQNHYLKKLPTFIRNYLCDSLWAYSLTMSVFCIYRVEEFCFYKTLLGCAIFEILMEGFQKIGVITGTFDVWDIYIELLTTLIACIFISQWKKRRTKEINYEK